METTRRLWDFTGRTVELDHLESMQQRWDEEYDDFLDTCEPGVVLHQICWTSDRAFHEGVKRGVVGGWIEGPECLGPKAWVDADAVVRKGARVFGLARVSQRAMIQAGSLVYGRAVVDGTARIRWARIYGQAQVHSAIVSGGVLPDTMARIYGRARVSTSREIYGDVRIGGQACVEGYACLYGLWAMSIRIRDEVRISQRAEIYGPADISGRVQIMDYAKVKSAALSGDIRLGGQARVGKSW